MRVKSPFSWRRSNAAKRWAVAMMIGMALSPITSLLIQQTTVQAQTAPTGAGFVIDANDLLDGMQLFRPCSTLAGRRQFNSQKHGTLVMTRYKADTRRRLFHARPYLDWNIHRLATPLYQ